MLVRSTSNGDLTVMKNILCAAALVAFSSFGMAVSANAVPAASLAGMSEQAAPAVEQVGFGRYHRYYNNKHYGYGHKNYGYGYKHNGYKYNHYGYGRKHYGYGHNNYGYGRKHYGYGYKHYGRGY
jgi:hypothetical protein